jgi:hypothetical protein
MRVLSVVGLLGSLALFGCARGAREANAPEANPWADYKGTYATGVPDRPSNLEPKSAQKASTAEKSEKVASASTSAAVIDTKPKATPTDAKSMYGVGEPKMEPDATPATPRKATAKKGTKKKKPAAAK